MSMRKVKGSLISLLQNRGQNQVTLDCVFYQSSIPSSGKTCGYDFNPKDCWLRLRQNHFFVIRSYKNSAKNATKEFLILQLKACRISWKDYC